MTDTTTIVQSERKFAESLGYLDGAGPEVRVHIHFMCDALEQQAAQIAEKDAEIARLTECLSKANANHEHFERAWYLRGDEVEALRADAERMTTALNKIAERQNSDWPDRCQALVNIARAALRQEGPKP